MSFCAFIFSFCAKNDKAIAVWFLGASSPRLDSFLPVDLQPSASMVDGRYRVQVKLLAGSICRR